MNKPITGIDFLGAGDFYTKVNDETTMKLGELGWPNPAIDKANQPQRTWVGLTDEERKAIRAKAAEYTDITDWNYTKRVQEATELALKEKNA